MSTEEERPKDLQKQLLKMIVDSYIDEMEKLKAELTESLTKEKAKNRDVKDLTEKLAHELLRLSPGHVLANDALVFLLENKMKSAGGKKSP